MKSLSSQNKTKKCNKESTIRPHRNTHDLFLKFDSKSINIIQKVNKGFTTLFYDHKLSFLCSKIKMLYFSSDMYNG